MSTAARSYSIREEIANSLSHGAGVVFGIVALLLLVIRSVQLADGVRVAAFAVYGLSVILLFLSSTLYHAIPHQGAKNVLRRVDHSAIYVLIAGTYTPFALLVIGDWPGALILAVIWSLAIAGIFFKAFFIHRFQNLSLVLYLGMGWLAVFAAYQLLHNLPFAGVALLLMGGIVYSAGVIFYKVRRIPFNHAIWHLFVLGGCLCHFLSIYWFVLPAHG